MSEQKIYTPFIQDDDGMLIPISLTAEKISKWLDIINYWYDDIKELAERYDNMYRMYEKYDKMIDEMYNLQKELEDDSERT